MVQEFWVPQWSSPAPHRWRRSRNERCCLRGETVTRNADIAINGQVDVDKGRLLAAQRRAVGDHSQYVSVPQDALHCLQRCRSRAPLQLCREISTP